MATSLQRTLIVLLFSNNPTIDKQPATPAIEASRSTARTDAPPDKLAGEIAAAVYKETPAARIMISNPTKQQRRGAHKQASSLIDRPAAATMTPASNGPACSDHSYELPLRRNLLLLLDLLDLLRFFAAVFLDRLGVVSCERGGVQLPGQTSWWRGGERADDDDDAAVERFIEEMLCAPRRLPVTSTTTRSRSRSTEARYRRRRAGDSEGAAVCAICSARLEAGGCETETVAELGVCSHAFHAACIDAWAVTGEAATCPLCRAPMSSSLPTAWDDDGRRQSS